ncbi:MAG: rRNA pseudouridine synthase [Planctomycetia bacterium]|nr:rRNA pseudouridine synthase [Planctomycetia bacterium]
MKHQAGRRVQLHRALSKLGWGSRTLAWDWIRAGQVRVDGQVVTDPLTWIDLDRQHVSRQGQDHASQARQVLALHKPRGVVTTRQDELGRDTVYDLLPENLPWLFPVGRLDADSEGLLLLTNDSQLAVQLTEPEHHVPKTYRITLRGTPDIPTLQKLRAGITLADGPTRPVSIQLINPTAANATVDMVLTEGRNRQIRRMWSAVGYRVLRLVRTAIGRFTLGDLPTGASRLLNPDEIQRLTLR